MFNRTRLTIAFGMAAWLAGACFAQEGAKAPEPKFYHLDFAVKEMDSGKVVNSRRYSSTTATAGMPGDAGCSIRTGSKVPVPAAGTTGNSVFTYIDLGVNIDCRAAKEIDGNLALNVTAEVSSAATSQNPPVVRQNRWNSSIFVPLGKPVVIFSSDDLTSKGQMQIELTATPIK